MRPAARLALNCAGAGARCSALARRRGPSDACDSTRRWRARDGAGPSAGSTAAAPCSQTADPGHAHDRQAVAPSHAQGGRAAVQSHEREPPAEQDDVERPWRRLLRGVAAGALSACLLAGQPCMAEE
eukprot:351311-Chlamydomonas_euryale.AAC.9